MLRSDQVRGRCDLYLTGDQPAPTGFVLSGLLDRAHAETGALMKSRTDRRFGLSVATGALLLGAGVASVWAAPFSPEPPPEPPAQTVTFSEKCLPQRIGGQFTRCDNLSGAGTHAPQHIPSVQRIGLGDVR